MPDKRLVNAIGWTVLVVWCISMILNVVIKDYSPPPSISAAMMVVVGAAFGSTSVAAWKKGREDDDPKV